MADDGVIRPLASGAHMALCRERQAEAAQGASLAMERARTRRSESNGDQEEGAAVIAAAMDAMKGERRWTD